MPFFSVVTPVFNRAALLREMLASVAAQRFEDFEVLLVDDGSTDDPAHIVQASGVKVEVLRQENRGPGAARNLGLRHATGEYVAFLDSDDVWFPWSLQTYADVLHATGKPAFLAGKPIPFQNARETFEAQEQPAEYLKFNDYLASGDEWRWWGVSSFVARREALVACGGFAEEPINGEDADLALKLGTARGFVQITDPVTFGYREHATNVTLNTAKTVAGLWHNIRAERSGGYPGGEERAMERWRILTRHVRPMILGCLKSGQKSEAWRLYRATIRWHSALGRWKFLVAFPWLALTQGSHVKIRKGAA
jgi:glycosyltransferase involved in cell wall biosynthesis